MGFQPSTQSPDESQNLTPTTSTVPSPATVHTDLDPTHGTNACIQSALRIAFFYWVTHGKKGEKRSSMRGVGYIWLWRFCDRSIGSLDCRILVSSHPHIDIPPRPTSTSTSTAASSSAPCLSTNHFVLPLPVSHDHDPSHHLALFRKRL